MGRVIGWLQVGQCARLRLRTRIRSAQAYTCDLNYHYCSYAHKETQRDSVCSTTPLRAGLAVSATTLSQH